ncbi:Carboxypeptidase regulatory-like domain-containing protein [Sulfidibacter corallicola]|uniref:carboxypeptidase T n=1 Tax=Sulfidibacter corallicola TaxID=2818388 RepID=A0A8A4TIP8_SULCO|nr:M14 family zinc carboxypeptidase [Sulfidibacter corallicola]QTD49367.1 carboxypeptidase regulatory-like domain-containing protein [Sulfidibacter corallicola]
MNNGLRLWASVLVLIYIASVDLFGQTRDFINETPYLEGPWFVRAYYADRDMLQKLSALHEPRMADRENGYVLVDISEEDIADLLALGLVLVVDEAATKRLKGPPAFRGVQRVGIPGFPCYPTVEETFSIAQELVTNHPDLAEWVDIGDSWEKLDNPEEGYDLMVLKLTNRNTAGDKPVWFSMSSVHAREYTTAPLMTQFARDLAAGYGVDADATWLLDTQEFHFLLIANPDGRKRAEAGQSWRKNADNDFCSGSSLRGIDLNRNFPFMWGCCGGSSGSACNETFRGPSAGSEPEASAIVNYVRTIFEDQRGDGVDDPAPDDASGIFFDMHSFSELVLWPYGFDTTEAPNGAALATLGRKMAFFNGYSPEKASQSFNTDGTTDDFAYGDLGIPAYTFELGTSFFQSCGFYENDILPKNLPALWYAARVARTPYLTPAGPDTFDVSLSAVAVLQGEAVNLTAELSDGRFNQSNGVEPTQTVAAAEYYVDMAPWEQGATGLPLASQDGAYDETQETVGVTLDSGALTTDRHTLYLRARDSDGNWGAVTAVFLYVLHPQLAPRIEGRVTQAETNQPLQATVTAGQFSTQTDETGHYSLTLPEGTYTLTVAADDHGSAQQTGVAAVEGEVLTRDFALQPICDQVTQDGEQGAAGWVASGTWALTDQVVHQGSFAWTDSPSGDYGNNRDMSLTSPSLSMAGVTNVRLTYWQRYDLESGYDYGIVEYRIAGGAWIEASRISGTNTTWNETEVALPDLDGEGEVQVRFRLTSDQGVTADGWYLDEIRLSGSGATCSETNFMDLIGRWPEGITVLDMVSRLE